MAQFTSGYDYNTGQLNASQQGDALTGFGGGGGGGGMDFGGLVGTILSERRRKEQQARADAMAQQRRQDLMMQNQQRRADVASRNAESRAAVGRQQNSPGNKMQEVNAWEHYFRNTASPSQKGTSLVGGMQGQAYADMAGKMAAMQAAGVPIADYTGFTELAKAGAGASAAAVGQAGENQRQQQSFSPAGMQYAALLNRR